MFEHLDERARTCIVLAQEEARAWPAARAATTPRICVAAIRCRSPSAWTLAASATWATPEVDRRRLRELMLVDDTPAARLLREHGIDETLLRESLGPRNAHG